MTRSRIVRADVPLAVPAPPEGPQADFSDVQSAAVLAEAARALASALGRQAAQAWFEQSELKERR
ncbi:MAG: hypothetical protein WD690_13925 [Vicinamibacterales bacterium]